MRFLLLAFLTLAACTAQSPAPTVDPGMPPSTESPFANITIAPASSDLASIVAGAPISMALKLNAGPTELSLLRLSITYPSDHSQTIVESVYGDSATISWIVPQESGLGTATYRLSTEGCGCGPNDKGQISEIQDSMVTGEFLIK